jgi:protein-tyrosine phosphatase
MPAPEQPTTPPPPPSPRLAYAQRARLERFNIAQSVDTHCHVLPGIDDGPATMDEALALCRAVVRDGITTAVATPHQLGRFEDRNSAADVRWHVAELQVSLDQHRIPLRVAAGAEVRVDERIPRLLAEDLVLTLANGRKYLLLELPSVVPVDVAGLVTRLDPKQTGVQLILAHAERYQWLASDPARAADWTERGIALQINAGGLLGTFGAAAQAAALGWLDRGWVSIVATDAHSTGSRRPRMTEAIELIASRFGDAVARCVCLENPLRILRRDELQKSRAVVASATPSPVAQTTLPPEADLR